MGLVSPFACTFRREEADAGWYSGEYDGEVVCEVGDVGCFLSVYAQCAGFFFDLDPQR